MSIHQRGDRWVVRYRSAGSNKSRTFPSETAATAFERGLGRTAGEAAVDLAGNAPHEIVTFDLVSGDDIAYLVSADNPEGGLSINLRYIDRGGPIQLMCISGREAVGIGEALIKVGHIAQRRNASDARP